jgi:uncharacterized BrkB/YihY/UPF0761 family membrane protein
MEGISLIYGDVERHSFLGRQIRGVLLFFVSLVAWLLAVVLSVFGRPLRQWITPVLGQSLLARGFWTVLLPVFAMVLAMLVLALIYRIARPAATTWSSVLPGAAAATSVVGINLRLEFTSAHAVWTCLRRAGGVIRLMVWMEFSAMIVFLGAA